MRAAFMSGDTLTLVMVMLPTRGSFSSRAITSNSTRCSSDSIFCRRLTESLQRPGNFDTRIALDLVVHAHVLVVLHADTALGTCTDLVDVVLETAQ